MKQLIKATLLAIGLSGAGTSAIEAQFSAGADGVIVLANTEVSIESLNIIPAADVNLTGKEITVSNAAVMTLSPPSIQRVITINSPLQFTGNIGLNYLPSELNGNTPISLNVFYHTGDFDFKNFSVITYDNTGNKVMASTVGPPITFAQITAASPIAGVPLPLKLISFDGKLKDDKTYMNWITFQENNVSHFEVERSVDNVQFTSIGKVNATGNSPGQQQYSFIDEKPSPGLNYYRLRMVDIDSKFTYSKTIVVRVGDIKGILIYPNPVSSDLHIEFNADRTQTAVYSLHAADGRTVLRGIFNVQKGANLFTINLAGLSPGTYVLNASNGSVSTIIKQ